MSASAHEIKFVLIYHTLMDKAVWVLPSQANHATLHDPYIVEVDENDKNFDEYAKLAGSKPSIYLKGNQI